MLLIYGDMPRGHLDSLESKLRDPRMQFLFRPGQWAPDKDGTTGADLDALLEAWIGADKPISVFDLSGIPTAVVDDLVGAVLRILYDAIFWGGDLKSEMQRLAAPVRCEDDEKIPADAGRRARDVGRVATARQEPEADW